MVISSSIEVFLWCKVSIHWEEESIPCSFLFVLLSSLLSIMIVVLLEHLLVDSFIIVHRLVFYHCWEWFEIGSSVELIIQSSVIDHVSCKGETTNAHSDKRVSSKELVCSSHWMNVWVVMNPLLIWCYSNSSWISLHSVSNKSSKWPSCAGSNNEPDQEMAPIFLLKFCLIFERDSLRTSHILSPSNG